MATYIEILQQIKNKTYAPLYLLDGEEAYYIDLISDYMEETILDESEKDFNLSILYGKDTNTGEIYSAVKRYPMMSNYNLVILKEAQSFQKFDELENYFKDPDPTTIFVMCYKYKKADKRKTFYKTIAKNGVVFTSEKIREEKIPDWIIDYCRKKRYEIDSKSAQILASFIGNDLSNITNELKKLFIIIPQGGKITPSIIEQNIGISKDFNAFELTKALSEQKLNKVYSIIKYFEANPKENPPQKIIPMIFPYFQRMLRFHYCTDKSKSSVAKALGTSPYFVDEYFSAARFFTLNRTLNCISILREYDLKSKGLDTSTGLTGGELIKEMIQKMIS
ncbi:MAG: DNA polymerase III subunit delta [Bacteroidales bacterium]|nr:DNA polymerase III subunit delta [Bacteroidales bacterium]MDY0388041.1 DNA polymerase III subunit delta [Methanolobus sp.]